MLVVLGGGCYGKQDPRAAENLQLSFNRSY